MKFVPHDGFQIAILLLSSAMAGIVDRIVFQQFLRCISQRILILDLHEMETADENVGTEGLHNLQDPLVGTAAE